ncbi:copper resistance D family protein [Paenibacillus sp. JDR-2]|uniref:copper resistance D family protein n=1 Tax=Paenibacillus sp. (strain JDR-2) TaxID=324057 RepID=UPI00016667F3|nr:CopD family protein [Paenibacillus sp. JDR-2]ACS99809.1 copper resistance D domain protein [Paenibacillus sp. JDR-2]
MYIYFFETLLYLSFAITAGYLLLEFIPGGLKPEVLVPVRIIQLAAIGIPIFSFASIVRTSVILMDFAPQMSFAEVLLIVLNDYSFGRAWIMSFILGSALFMVISFNGLKHKSSKWVAAGIWICMVLVHGYASHPAALSKTWGLLAQTIHVGAVSVWLGILILVAWFRKGSWNWRAFTRWYTPLSIACMTLIVIAGFVMMSIIIEVGYINSWGINYGEALLLKHLLFIPLILLAFMNGFLTKIYANGQNERSLQSWLKAEGLVALFILITTAFMGIQEPPHETESEEPVPSPLFKLLHNERTDLSLQWHWNMVGALCVAMGLISFLLLFAAYRKNKMGLFAICTVAAVLFPFLGLLQSVS